MQADEVKVNCRSSRLSEQDHIIEQIGENGNIQYNCTACRKVFRSRSQRYYHINCNQLQNLIYKCDHCEKSFARRTQWKYHVEAHLSPVNKCDKCQKTFSNPLALKKHLNLHKAQPMFCPHCDKTFKKKLSLEQHIFGQHLNQLQYGCAHCNKKYASKSTLQMHLQTHEKKRFECTFCGKLFQRNSILNLHIKRHNNTNILKCKICEKTFSESGALARHNKLHQESALQYYCKICDKSMVRKDNMARHLTTIHPEKMFDEIVKTIKPLSNQQAGVDANKKSFIILENKLLREPFVDKESFSNFPQMFTKNSITEEYPVVNKIKVITAVPTNEIKIFSKYAENTEDECGNEYKITNHFQQTNAMTETQRDSSKTQCKIVEENVVNMNNDYEKNIDQSKELIVEQQLDNYQREINHQQICNEQTSAKRETVVQHTFSSVIRSVGNVKKDLKSNDILSVNANKPISVEYQHKKYCRNNYNIDLYRRILGFDEDDEDENTQKQKYDHVTKSSTPLHWRKCFKNNYETSGS